MLCVHTGVEMVSNVLFSFCITYSEYLTEYLRDWFRKKYFFGTMILCLDLVVILCLNLYVVILCSIFLFILCLDFVTSERLNTHRHTRKHIRTQSHIRVYTHAHIHTYIHKYVHMEKTNDGTQFLYFCLKICTFSHSTVINEETVHRDLRVILKRSLSNF